MDRRTILKAGLGAGIVFTAEQIQGGEASDAGAAKATFYTGTFAGGPAGSWDLTIGIAATRARGYVNGWPIDGSDVVGYRMSGRLAGKSLTLTLFSLSDVKETTPLGTLTATVSANALAGTFTLLDGRGGRVAARRLQPSAKMMKKMAGNFDGAVLAGGDTVGGGRLTATASGSWTATKINVRGTPFTGRIPGYFAADAHGKLCAMVIPVASPQAPHATDDGGSILPLCVVLAENIQDSPCCKETNGPAPPPGVGTGKVTVSQGSTIAEWQQKQLSDMGQQLDTPGTAMWQAFHR